MGSSKKQTVSYWYHPFFQLALHEGPFDKLLKIRGGDVDAWVGELTASGSIEVDQPNLWGGEEKEGGIQGTFDVMFGEMDAEPNAYIQTALGPDPSNHNGVALLQFNSGRYGAGNPYPKPISVLTERIYAGWLDGVCWYPEKAAVPLIAAPMWSMQWRATSNNPHLFTAPAEVATWSSNPDDYSVVDVGSLINWPTGIGAVGLAWLHINAPQGVPQSFHIDVKTNYDDSGAVIGVHNVTLGAATPPEEVPTYPRAEGVRVIVPESNGPFSGWVCYACVDGRDIETGGTLGSATAHRMLNSSVSVIAEQHAMNPAHVIYDSLAYLQGEPVASIDEPSFAAAADRLYQEGFGICTKYNHAQETIEQFRQRILDLIGAECSRYNGKWYLDLIRELSPAEIAVLPVLTDDDILDWQEDPTNRDDAVNQVAVKWFDPDTKQSRITPHVHALAAINTLGSVNPEVRDYPEIPYEALANRMALRDLHNKSTPTRRFNQTTNRKPYNWRKGHAFRLQSPKRGIADMVCRVADIDRGTLQSGAIRLVAVQDSFAMPATAYVVGQPTVSEPSPVPEPIVHQVLFEAPYVELAGVLSAGDLAALDPDAGYILALGAKPGNGQGYALLTRPSGSEFDRIGTFDWCPSALVTEGSGFTDTGFTLSGGSMLARVGLGSAAVWGSEIVRVDALDLETGAVTLGRACADTVAVKHAAGERIYFYDAWAATDSIEYATAETVEAKLLPRTGTQEADPEDVAPLSVVLDQRAARPYPPAALTINGQADPTSLSGTLALLVAFRDRIAQADQLVDQSVGDIGPEAGVTLTVRCYLNEVLDDTQTGIAGNTVAVTPSGNGLVRIEVEAERDGLVSWQAQIREFSYTINSPDRRVTVGGDSRVTVAGDFRITKG
ncbi:phage tail protein [uncultured Luteimonas sp.]|uniref:phage tail protein n=1 Tax=uncultured Luteimonas sp. TaxID=453144 RepID=UPI0026016437|nr:phage tail protein [uncultured Luteimonas sp.]